MNNLEQIQKSLDYIEENLKTTLTLAELSAVAGFSPFHYCREFRRVVGLGTAQYLARRRLLWAAYDIARGRKVPCDAGNLNENVFAVGDFLYGKISKLPFAVRLR